MNWVLRIGMKIKMITPILQMRKLETLKNSVLEFFAVLLLDYYMQ